MADRLVHLELHLLGVDHDRRHARPGTRRRGGARPPPRRPAAPRARGRAPRRTPSRPARSSRRARSGSCAPGRSRRRPRSRRSRRRTRRAPARSRRPRRRGTACARGSARTHAWRDLHVGVPQRLLGAQAERDLVLERDVERVALHRRCDSVPERASSGASARPFRAGGGGEGAGAEGGVPRALGVRRRSQAKPQAPSTSTRTPMPSRLGVGERVDAAVLRRRPTARGATTARASAYDAPAPSAASTAAAAASRTASQPTRAKRDRARPCGRGIA